MANMATRAAYGATLLELAQTCDLVVLDADLAKATNTVKFRDKYPDRFIDCGIAEGNMMGVAAGLALSGKTVFASSFAMFAAGRAFEQIRNSIGYPAVPVNIAATHAGLSVGEDGATHQCNEDISLMRTIPGMVILNPCDDVSTAALIRAAAAWPGPTYSRLGRLAVDSVYAPDETFEIGKAKTLREGGDLTIIATGLMVHEALKAADILAGEGIKARVLDMHTIKPIDADAVVAAAKETGVIITCEEHTVLGGLGGAVCEVTAEKAPCKVVRIGVNDTYGKSGPAKAVLEKFGLCAANIADKARAAIK